VSHGLGVSGFVAFYERGVVLPSFDTGLGSHGLFSKNRETSNLEAE
jgi:hypothetical protein